MTARSHTRSRRKARARYRRPEPTPPPPEQQRDREWMSDRIDELLAGGVVIPRRRTPGSHPSAPTEPTPGKRRSEVPDGTGDFRRAA